MKPFVWSYTSLRDFALCPKQFFHKHIARDLPKEDSPALRTGIEVHDVMERRVRDHDDLPALYQAYEPFAAALDGHPVQAELQLGITVDGKATGFFAPNVWGRGKLDVSIVYDGTAWIGDWKTGKIREDADELQTFGVLLKAHQPQLTRITGNLIWLKDMKMGKTYDLSDTAVKLAEIRGRMEKVTNAIRFGAWPATENPLCGWCPVRSCSFNRRAD